MTNKKNLSYLEQMISWERIFNKDAEMPQSPLDCRKWFIKLTVDLSPENLSCDGEISGNALKKKLKEIDGAWKELENIYGKKVSNDTAERWMME